MLFRAVSVALWASVCGVSGVQAQSVADLSGPTSLPPPGFKGQQFVDNRGCVFLRAGYSGQTNWVPRVTRDRKPMCGYPPSFGRQQAVDVAELAPATKPAAKARAVPVAVAVNAAAPYATTPPASQQRPVYAAQRTTAGTFGCYAEAPVAEAVSLSGGGSAIVCTRGDGSATGWRPPMPGETATPLAAGRVATRAKYSAERTEYVQIEPIPTPPKGYILAWKDDRLNPYRGIGTDQGWADQDMVWTRDVPAKLVVKVKKSLPVAQQRVRITYSAKNAPGLILRGGDN